MCKYMHEGRCYVILTVWQCHLKAIAILTWRQWHKSHWIAMKHGNNHGILVPSVSIVVFWSVLASLVNHWLIRCLFRPITATNMGFIHSKLVQKRRCDSKYWECRPFDAYAYGGAPYRINLMHNETMGQVVSCVCMCCVMCMVRRMLTDWL